METIKMQLNDRLLLEIQMFDVFDIEFFYFFYVVEQLEKIFEKEMA